MVGTSKKNKKNIKKGTVSVEYQCPLNLLLCDMWVKIAMNVAPNSIQDLFNMQATCKVFLDAARSDFVYKHASMLELRIASFLYYACRPAKRFIYCYARAENLVALLWVGMIDFF
ncbi:uncharacterized protein LOC127740512 [Arachis duranensis]|uniref:F-box domain-containing protein n=2 Tax=Arachis TaxID=3817 RepID=A0A445C7M2_ARAHY|nr:uncharacterized protein LOC127740512 [Arachis duranensis]RYR46898.1 hypothetical protein Ahy_A07g032762 [Arachis hypogaea]